MSKTSLLIFSIFALAAFSASATDTPRYQVLMNIAPGIEIRQYEPSKWLSTSSYGQSRYMYYNSNMQASMFTKLFNYMSSQKIEMTTPVVAEYRSTAMALINENTNVKMSMKAFVPADKQCAMPTPSDSMQMSLENDSGMVVAAIKFGGFATMADYFRNRDQLIRALGPYAKSFDVINFMAASYNAPFQTENRRNEVWLKKLY